MGTKYDALSKDEKACIDILAGERWTEESGRNAWALNHKNEFIENVKEACASTTENVKTAIEAVRLKYSFGSNLRPPTYTNS